MRAALLVVALMAVAWLLAPNVLMLGLGGLTIVAGLVLLPLAIVGHGLAGHRLIEGVALGGLVGWLLGRRRTAGHTRRDA